jgi:hypothetical protein
MSIGIVKPSSGTPPNGTVPVCAGVALWPTAPTERRPDVTLLAYDEGRTSTTMAHWPEALTPAQVSTITARI